MDARTEEKERLITKQRLMQERGGVCDCCGKAQATQLHEMVSRGKTFRHTEARTLCYADEVVAILCHDCHAAIHDSNPKLQQAIWSHLFQRYGREQVVTRIGEIKMAMKSHLYVELPE